MNDFAGGEKNLDQTLQREESLKTSLPSETNINIGQNPCKIAETGESSLPLYLSVGNCSQVNVTLM